MSMDEMDLSETILAIVGARLNEGELLALRSWPDEKREDFAAEIFVLLTGDDYPVSKAISITWPKYSAIERI